MSDYDEKAKLREFLEVGMPASMVSALTNTHGNSTGSTPMTTPQTTPELLAREKFEQLAADRLKWKASVIAQWRGPNGDYDGDRDLRLMWAAWAAATQERAAPLEGVSETKLTKTAPERIYLVVGEDAPDDVDFHELSDSDITWCADKIDSNSIAYVRADLRAPESPQPLAPPPGWKMVPIEVTPEMLVAGGKECEREEVDDETAEKYRSRGEAVACFNAMVAAAPQPPASVQPLAVGVEMPEKHRPTVAAHLMKLVTRVCAEFHDYSRLRNNWTGGEALKARKAYRATLDEIEDGLRLLASPPPPGGMVPLTEQRMDEVLADFVWECPKSVLHLIGREVEKAHGITSGAP